MTCAPPGRARPASARPQTQSPRRRGRLLRDAFSRGLAFAPLGDNSIDFRDRNEPGLHVAARHLLEREPVREARALNPGALASLRKRLVRLSPRDHLVDGRARNTPPERLPRWRRRHLEAVRARMQQPPFESLARDAASTRRGVNLLRLEPRGDGFVHAVRIDDVVMALRLREPRTGALQRHAVPGENPPERGRREPDALRRLREVLEP